MVGKTAWPSVQRVPTFQCPRQAPRALPQPHTSKPARTYQHLLTQLPQASLATGPAASAELVAAGVLAGIVLNDAALATSARQGALILSETDVNLLLRSSAAAR